MFTNSIVFENILLVATAEVNAVYLAKALEKVVSVVQGFESFLSTIIVPILIISGLTTGVRS